MTIWTVRIMVREEDSKMANGQPQTVAYSDYMMPTLIAGAAVDQHVRDALRVIMEDARDRMVIIMKSLYENEPTTTRLTAAGPDAPTTIRLGDFHPDAPKLLIDAEAWPRRRKGQP